MEKIDDITIDTTMDNRGEVETWLHQGDDTVVIRNTYNIPRLIAELQKIYDLNKEQQ